MSNLILALLAYLIDRRFGEFTSIKHPIIIIGELISFFEEKFYRDSVLRGAFLVLFILSIVGVLSLSLSLYLSYFPWWLHLLISATIASMFLAHNMLRESVLSVVNTQEKHSAIAMLVSRDTEDMSESDIYRAALETYGENLSDGVVAPLFYLLLFNLPGIIIYKAINTMDSMVGYRNSHYEKYGKVAAIVDDIANYIPSRLTALLIMICAKKRPLFAFYTDGKRHASPNAGHPITALALAVGVKLGGETSYFGKIEQKPHFGEGKTQIEAEDVKRALEIL